MKKLENLPNVSAPTAEFPYGDVNDNTGTNNGTPLNRASMSDMFQFFAKLADEAGVVPNDVVDNEYGMSLHLEVESKADLDAYQTDPVHLAFVGRFKANWVKIRVFDTAI